jgi:hypothetical protein
MEATEVITKDVDDAINACEVVFWSHPDRTSSYIYATVPGGNRYAIGTNKAGNVNEGEGWFKCNSVGDKPTYCEALPIVEVAELLEHHPLKGVFMPNVPAYEFKKALAAYQQSRDELQRLEIAAMDAKRLSLESRKQMESAWSEAGMPEGALTIGDSVVVLTQDNGELSIRIEKVLKL